MWDDTSLHWGRESVLQLQGRPIALVYWPELYRYGKELQWKGIKAPWCDWKFIVERYRRGSREAFWAEFTEENGTYMSYTKIASILRQQRMQADQEIVERAKAEYGDEFDVVFSYRKGNTHRVMTDPASIASKYRSRHPN
ncbi:hypothetical protein PLICRDRAFT_119756 [Plicaturopsis crispa FD-325 SS-3]|uniref:Uncharacterized protein n=1 Tax=Plicaturopsis crispa FD-325 SS-3 TaxID=944288 RepID=A0A0C9T1W1_PLICR|nr:hypothetical protein PLICRDRAFT_119756 [Plicaturopsis crispa FD-325 SS-3]